MPLRQLSVLPLLLFSMIYWLKPSITDAQTAVPIMADEEYIIANEASVDYPTEVHFRLEVDPEITIVDALLTYDVEQTSCLDVSTQVPVQVDGPIIKWDWAMIRSGNPPPGVELWWEWTLTDDQGQTYTTSRQNLKFADDRFPWQTITQGDVTLHWYAGEEVGPILLESAVDGLLLLEEDLGIELHEDVEFYIYGGSADMRDAVLYIQDWAGGVAFPEYNIILMGVPPDIADDWGRSTIRHELAHLVVGQYGRSCVGGHRPTWLEEGLAMYAEGEPASDVTADLDQAIQENSFAPLRSLSGSFPAHDDAAGSAYSQSYSTIEFLRDEYGQEKLQMLLLLLAEGASYDDALEQIYNVNVDGLEQQWRTWINVPARRIPPTPIPINAASIPTVAPLDGPATVPTPLASDSQPAVSSAPAPSSGICGFGLLPLLLLGVFTWRKKSIS
jgi:hypothetical protein